MLGCNFECSAERAARTAVVSRTFEARGVSPRPGVAEFWEGRDLPRRLAVQAGSKPQDDDGFQVRRSPCSCSILFPWAPVGSLL